MEDIKSYLDFGDEDASTLLQLQPVLSPHFERLATQFYDRVLSHPGTRVIYERAGTPVDNLRTTLIAWMRSGLAGPHDETFFEQRARVGEAHVKIGLPQQYIVTAMHVLRTAYRRVLLDAYADDPSGFERASGAIERLFGLELAIMLHTYRMDSEDRLRRRERLAALGQVAASIGHDLRNPLAVIDSSTYVLRRRCAGDDKILRHVDRIAAHATACERIVSNVLELAADRPLVVEPIDIRAAFDDAVASARVPDGIVIRYDVPEGVSLSGDRKLVARAMANLITNAVDAIGRDGGTLGLGATADDETISLSVSDDGPGFDPSIVATIFDTHAPPEGHKGGLGLPLVKCVVERHGGRVSAENERDGGARVTLVFPRASARAPAAGASRSPTRAVARYMH